MFIKKVFIVNDTFVKVGIFKKFFKKYFAKDIFCINGTFLRTGFDILSNKHLLIKSNLILQKFDCSTKKNTFL